jgi:hypothetical protein
MKLSTTIGIAAGIILLAIPLGITLFNSASSQNVSNILSNDTNEDNPVLYNISESTSFILTVQSGDKSIYERGGNLHPLPIEWGDKTIPINGYVVKTTERGNYEEQIVKVIAYQDEETIFQQFLQTSGTGFYNTTFYPPSDGTIRIKSILMSQTPTVEATVSVIATQSWSPAILITIFISLSIGLAVVFTIRGRQKDSNNNLIHPDTLKAGLIPIAILNVLTYILLYKFPPLDSTGNAALAAALIAPMAAYIYETLKQS